MPARRTRVLLLRGAQLNPWELRTWEELDERFEIRFALTNSNIHELPGLRLDPVRVPALSDLVPPGAARRLAAVAPVNRYLGLRRELAEADIVHAAELSYWFSAQAARLKPQHRYRLVITVWETIPFGHALRHPLSRPNRRLVLERTDVFLAASERARDTLILEGVDPARIRVCPPGVDTARFRRPADRPAPARHTMVSPGRLVWEKGHQDAIRAVAALRIGLVHSPAAEPPLLRIVGSGRERTRLEAHARDLGVADLVEFIPNVPYEEMPDVYFDASCMLLASLPIPSWEEQFGMVLAEAMAAGLPILATTSGAIPEVAGAGASYFAPGDWLGLARLLAGGPLARPPGEVVRHPPELVERHSTRAAAARLADAYDALA